MINIIAVGLCGGFTTFSTFALETSDLIKNGCWGMALLYILGSVIAGIGVIFAIEYLQVK